MRLRFPSGGLARAAAAPFAASLLMAATVQAAPRDPLVLDDSSALQAFAAAEQARPPAGRHARTAFLARPLLVQARLSPDGRQVAALIDDGRQRSLRMASRDQPGGQPRLTRTAATGIDYSRDGRWLFLVEPTRVLAIGTREGVPSSAVAILGGRSHRRFAGVDPWLPAAVLVLETPPVNAAPPRIFRLWRALPGGGSRLLHASHREIVDFAFTPEGALSHLILASGESHVLLRREGAGWRALAVCARMQRCGLIGTADADGAALLRSDLDGDRQALLRVHADGRRTRLHGDPQDVADLDELVTARTDNMPLVAAYRSTVARNHGLTPQARAIVAALEARFPGRSLRLQPGETHWLVEERAASLQRARLHLVDPMRPRAAGIELFADVGTQFQGRAVAPLPEPELARQRAVAWTASDGLRLHGFLLLPPGVEVARAPLLVLVHGGPFNHVQPLFNAQAQFLANRGHLVFLPNFRSSTGHGRRLVLAGRGDFTGDGRVQRDIVEGTRWLLSHGIGDPARVGIVGASFGGFSALNGVTFQPELFRVGIAAVPPSDFGFVVREYLGAGKPMQPGVPIAASMRHLGLDPSDRGLMARLAARSPQAHAARMSRPLLVLAGGEDDRVPIRGVTHYAATLRQLGKDVSLFVDAESGHGLADPRTREAYLYLQESILQRIFGGPAAEPPDKALAAHLARNLRLRGPSLSEPLPGAASRAAPKPR